jgi:hypothetical protein
LYGTGSLFCNYSASLIENMLLVVWIESLLADTRHIFISKISNQLIFNNFGRSISLLTLLPSVWHFAMIFSDTDYDFKLTLFYIMLVQGRSLVSFCKPADILKSYWKKFLILLIDWLKAYLNEVQIYIYIVDVWAYIFKFILHLSIYLYKENKTN